MNNTVARDSVKLTVMKTITLTLGIFSAMLLSRFRTLNEYGTYSQINMTVSIIISFMALGLPNSINYFLASSDNQEKKSKFLSSFFTFITILSLLAGVSLVILVPILVKYYKNEYINKFVFALLTLPWIRLINSSLDNVLVVEKKTNILINYRITRSFTTILLIIIAWVFDWTFLFYMKLFIFSEIVFSIIIYLIVRKISNSILIGFDLNLMKKILSFSLPLGLASIIGTFNIQIDKIMVSYFYDTETLAIYTNAAREMPVTIIASSITAVLMPRLVKLIKERKYDETSQLWGTATLLSYIFICFISISLFVFAPQVISLLYSSKYLPGVNIFRVYSLILLLRTTYFGIILNSKGKTKLIFYSSILTLLLNILLNFFLYYMIGIIGFSVASLLSLLIVAYLQLVLTAKELNKSILNLMPWKYMFKITIINIIIGIFIYYITEHLSIEIYIGTILEAITFGLLWLLFYIMSMRKLIIKTWNILDSN